MSSRSIRVRLMPVLLALIVAGCSQSGGAVEDPAASAPVAENNAPAQPLELGEDAPTIDQAYPRLASGVLAHARLAELPDELLLRAGEVTVKLAEIESEIAEAPEAIREQLREHAFFLLEQMVTERLLIQEAREAAGNASADVSGEDLLRDHIQGVVGELSVGEDEIRQFYDDNQSLMQGMPLEVVKGQIEQTLMGRKQKAAFEDHVLSLGRRMGVAVDADWAARQAQLAAKNPVNKARASGKPTLASFGADSCVPCRMMAPIREELRQAYGGRANIIYVRVDEEQILAARYGVHGIPHLIFFGPDGREVMQQTGIMTKEQIEAQFAAMGVEN